MDVVRKIPQQISSTGAGGQGGQYQLADNAYDYAIAGIPFLSATQDSRPYTERMAEVRKQQFDNFAEPGEQSLQGWWLRSQSTFSGGAGVLYQDPDNDNQFNYRFAKSLGVDPWTSGELSLLRAVESGPTSLDVPALVRGYSTPGGVDAYWYTSGDNMRKVTDAATTTVITGAGEEIWDITSTGATYFIAVADGIKSGVDGAAPTTQYAGTYNSTAVIEFVKARLVFAHDNNIYQLVASPASPPAALPTATYTHQDPSWRWRSITDGPNAIYVAGDSGTTSEIHKLSPTISGTGVPELTWTGVTATMPAGEIINTIYQYIGSFVGIATNKGFRVGEIDSNGDISYGPLLFEVDSGASGIVGYDRFMFVGTSNAHDGGSGLYRVDLGSSIQEQTTRAVRYAYARDVYTGTPGIVTSVTMVGTSDRKVFAISEVGTFREYATQLLTSGYLETGRVRFNTEEPKLYKFFSVRTPTPLKGTVTVDVLSEGGGEITHFTFSPTLPPGVRDIAIQNPSQPQNWIKLRFTLGRGPNPAFGGVLNGWQLKALPGSIRQRVITQIFQLFDEEKDRTNQRIGYDGYARARFEDFKAVARSGDVFSFQELQEDIATQVIIEDWEFRQTAPPGPNREVLGGYLTVQMRTVAEST